MERMEVRTNVAVEQCAEELRALNGAEPGARGSVQSSGWRGKDSDTSSALILATMHGQIRSWLFVMGR